MMDPKTATAEQLDWHLAKEVMGWIMSGGHWLGPDGISQCFNSDWNPTQDRNRLSEVLDKVPEELREPVMRALDELAYNNAEDWYWFLLTAKATDICRAIAIVLSERKATA